MTLQYSTGSLSTLSGTDLVFDHIEDEGPMWIEKGERWAEHPIRFDSPFDKAPHVLLSVEMIDADHSTNLRLQLRAEEVRRGGFKAVAYTWSDTRIGRLSVSWLAIGRTGSEWDV
ncbi:MAG: H-type lectin domain-containing protein [Pseudomonadota bacterium]